MTYNWDPESYGEGRNFGHLAYEVEDIYATCDKLMKAGVTINRPPRDGNMAFVRSPGNISIELLQKGPAKAPAEPWTSMKTPASGSSARLRRSGGHAVIGEAFDRPGDVVVRQDDRRNRAR